MKKSSCGQERSAADSIQRCEEEKNDEVTEKEKSLIDKR